MVGVGLADTYFSDMAGRSRFGKTELAINRFIHLARAGHGCFFLDPHEDGLERIKPHLIDIADRQRWTRAAADAGSAMSRSSSTGSTG